MNIIESWWFKLYTKNILFTLIKTLGIFLAVDFVATSYGGPLATLCFYLVLAYPVKYFLESKKG